MPSPGKSVGQPVQHDVDLMKRNAAPAVTVSYPARGGSSLIADWASWQQLNKTQQARLKSIDGGLAAQRSALRPDEQPLTTERLQSVSAGLRANLRAIDGLLQPLNDVTSSPVASFKRFFPAPASKPAVLSPHAAGHIDLNNLRYLLRDWSSGEFSWGQGEIGAMMAALRPAFDAIGTGRPVVAAGAGAMRLPIEVAEELGAANCTLIELDALLCQASAAVLSGQKLELVEIPDEPINSAAISQTLSLPKGWQTDLALEIQCGDANELVPAALTAAERPLLFTPFIIDVAGGDILQRCRRWVEAMPVGSRWLNIGPISVREPHSRMNYGVDEVRHCLQNAGLAIDYEKQVFIPHLNSPHNRRQQEYCCWVFSGERC